jgi:hypothetical protein
MTQAQTIAALMTIITCLLAINMFLSGVVGLLLLRRIDTEQVRRLLEWVMRRDNHRVP